MVVVVNCVVIAITVMIHYEFLHQFTAIMPKLQLRPRFRIVLGVFAALCAHTIEVWLFAFVYFFMQQHDSWGHFQGNFDGNLLDCVYFSFTTYTTLGTGDIEPFGSLRFLAGLESLTGLLLITWSASFLYLQMVRYWDND